MVNGFDPEERVGGFIETDTVTIETTWRDGGYVTLSRAGTQFRYHHLPDVYRIRVNLNDEQIKCYIGHSVNFARRVKEDLGDAKKIQVICQALLDGGNVRVDRAEDVTYWLNQSPGAPIVADRGEFVRLMIEGVAVAVESTNLGLLNAARHRL